jgi:hypothetical protein
MDRVRKPTNSEPYRIYVYIEQPDTVSPCPESFESKRVQEHFLVAVMFTSTQVRERGALIWTCTKSDRDRTMSLNSLHVST